MKYNPSESYADWAKRVEMYENGYAKMRIAEGEDIDKVLEDMSRRITEKILHPILKSLRENPSNIDTEEFESSKQQYYEKMKNIGPKSDHVSDDS